MTNPQEKVLTLKNNGNINRRDARSLLGALGQRSVFSRLFFGNPFERLSDREGGILTAVYLIGAILVSVLLGVRFDGFFDVHLVTSSLQWYRAALDQIGAWLIPGLCLWGVARVAGRQGRLLDFLFLAAIARSPIVILGALFGAVENLSMVGFLGNPTVERVIYAVFAFIVAIILLVWFIVWLYRGFRTSSGLKKRRLVVTFVIGITLAEILSKIAAIGTQTALAQTQASTERDIDAAELVGDTPIEKAQYAVELWNSSSYAKLQNTFDQKMKSSMGVFQLALVSEVQKLASGELLKVDEIHHRQYRQHQIVDFECTFKRARKVLRIVLGSSGQISGFWILDPRQSTELPNEDKQDINFR